MSWTEGKRRKIPLIDWNEEYSKLQGELSDEVAKKTFARFLMHNVGYLIHQMTGFELYPLQRLVIKGWLMKNNTLTVASRGFGKSMLFSHFCYLYCLFNPGKRIVMVSETFRSSRRIVENIASWAASERGILLRQTIVAQPKGDLLKKRQDLFEIEFKNGASIVALPMGGDPEKLRGYRCSVLGVDEGLRIPQVVIDTVLKPFLVATDVKEIQRRQHIRRREDQAIKNGRMKEEDRAEFTSNNKMIILSSASYSWQDLFTLYKQYLERIYAEDEAVLKTLTEEQKLKLLEKIEKEMKKEREKEKDKTAKASYLVHQLSYRVIHKDAIDATMREELEGDTMSENTKRREYGAEFVQDSDGFFRAKIMEECTLKGDNAPTIEIVGEKDAQYLLAIDPNMAAGETADHFAMVLIKIVDHKKFDGTTKKVGLVVHQYANAGAELKHHIAYLCYLLQAFNVVYLAVDTSQGDNSDFVNICNESEHFKTQKINLKPIDADFGKETFDEIVPQIQRSYSKGLNRIVQKQYFHSAFQKAANMHMQDSFDRRSLLFAAKALASPNAMEIMRGIDVGPILNSHPAFVDEDVEGSRGSIDAFVNHQDALIDLVKKECALIQIKVSSLGNESYDLPAHMKKQTTNPGRVRRDNYSALLLGNWALKLYLEAQDRPKENDEAPFYFGWVGAR